MKKRKLLCLFVALAMVFSMSIPAFGATNSGPDISAQFNKSTGTVVIDVDGVTAVFTGISNNTTQAFTVNGWEVNVTAKNDTATINSKKQVAVVKDIAPAVDDVVITATYVKKTETVAITVDGVTETFTKISNNTTKAFVVNGWEVNVTAKNDVATVNSKKKLAAGVTEPEKRIVEVEQSWSKTTFHCNTCGGNGRVWPQVGPYNKKNDGKIFLVLEEIPGTTAWHLIDVKDAKGNSLGVPTCPGKHEYCGSSDWISFSNNSGVPDGKNIQLHHGNPDDPGDFSGMFFLDKTVNGIEGGYWLSGFDGDVYALLDDIVFEVYKVDGKNAPYEGEPFTVGALEPSGTISFASLEFTEGWYAVVEKLGDYAKTVFEEVGPLYINIIGFDEATHEAILDGAGETWTIPEGPFTGINNGFTHTMAALATDGTIIAPLINQTAWKNWFQAQFNSYGETIQYETFSASDLKVEAANGTFTSFCAALSLHAYGDGLLPGNIGLTAEQEKLMIAALDWVYDMYGDFEDMDSLQYALAQALVWKIIDKIELVEVYNIDKIMVFNGAGVLIDPDTIDSILANCLEAYAEREAAGAKRVAGILCLESVMANGQPQIVPYFVEGGTVTFDNKPTDNGGFEGQLSLNKTVEGDLIGNWLIDGDFNDEEIFAILNDIKFEVYKSDKFGATGGDFVADGWLELPGDIAFSPKIEEAGWYLVHEVMGDIASEIFDEVDDVLIYFDGKNVSGSGALDTGFNPDGTYWFDKEAYDAALTIEAFPGMGDFHVTDGVNSYSSFCAMFGIGTDPSNPLKANDLFEGNKADVIKAFNYIYDNWGSITQWPKFDNSAWYNHYRYNSLEYPSENDATLATKAIAQLVLWSMLDPSKDWSMDEQYGSDRFIAKAINDAVKDTLANYKTVEVGNNITDVIFLAYIDDGGRIHGSQPQLVPIYGGVTFDNKPKEEGGFEGQLALNKTVEGDLIGNWMLDKDFEPEDVLAIIEDIKFMVYKSDEFGTVGGDLVANGLLEFPGEISFSPKINEAGWYLIHEEVGETAAEYFTAADDMLIYYNNATGVIGGEFDLSALYSIINGYSGAYIKTLGYPGLNNNGDIFSIAVKNVSTGEEYPSFCANAGSKNFAGDNNIGCKGYMVGKPTDLVENADFLDAFNYIEGNYGNVDAQRVITQTVIWALLGAIDVDSPEFDATNLTSDEKAAVRDVMANHKGYTACDNIKGLVFMVCENHEHSFEYCQPQLVPLYNVAFENQPTGGFEGQLMINKTVGGELIVDWLFDGDFTIEEIVAILGDITFELYIADEDGNPIGDAVATCENVGGGSEISFSPKVPAGHYLVHEVMGDIASAIFEQVPDMIIDYDGEDVSDDNITLAFDNIAKLPLNVTAKVALNKEYRYFEPRAEDKTSTLVSKQNQGGGALNGNQRYVAIDVDAAANGGLWFEIADSSPSNIGIGYGYTVSVVNGKIIVSFDENLVKADVGIMAASSPGGLTNGHPNGKDGTAQGILSAGDSLSVALPAGETVYLFVHIAGGIEWNDYSLPKDKWTEVGRETVPGEYTGTLKLTIEGPDGYSKVIKNFNGSFSDLVASGTYICTLTGWGFDPQVKTVVVVDEELTVAFDVLVTVVKEVYSTPPIVELSVPLIEPAVLKLGVGEPVVAPEPDPDPVDPDGDGGDGGDGDDGGDGGFEPGTED